MMLSSALPHCSWELASDYRSTTKHAEYLLYVGYVWRCLQLYLVFTAFSSCTRSLMNFRHVCFFDNRLMLHDVTTKGFTESTERPAGQFNSHAQLGIHRSPFCRWRCLMGVSRAITATFFDLVYNAKNSMHIYLKKKIFFYYSYSALLKCITYYVSL